MRQATLAVVAFIFLTASSGRPPPAALPKQGNPAQAPGTSSTGLPDAQVARTPRQDEELRADILMAQKQYAEAAAIYQKLIQQEPRNAVLLNKIGIAYQQQALLDQAKRYYERAMKADRTYAHAYNNVGTIYYQRKNYRKAIKAYEKALAIQEEMPAVHSNLGYAYFARRHFPEAMAAFRRALELDPAVFERSQSAGTLLQDRSVSDRGLFYFFLAKSFATLGNAERCAYYLRKARDEGYKELLSAQTDPAFASVIQDPGVKEVLQLTLPGDDKLRSAPPKPPGSAL